MEEVVLRKEAIKRLLPEWDAYRHVGTVPTEEERMSLLPRISSVKNSTPVSNSFQLLSSDDREEKEYHEAGPQPSAAASPEPAIVIKASNWVPLPDTGHSVVEWIGDTGSGHDLTSRQKLECPRKQEFRSNDGISLNTVNGSVDANRRANIALEELREQISPLLPDSTPDALTIGRRCALLGYGFVWEPFHADPWFVLPGGSSESTLSRGTSCLTYGGVPNRTGGTATVFSVDGTGGCSLRPRPRKRSWRHGYGLTMTSKGAEPPSTRRVHRGKRFGSVKPTTSTLVV